MTQPADIAPPPSPAPKPAKSRLRRLTTATILALLAGTVAAGITFLCQPDQYQCTGMIHIRPVITPLLFNTPGTMPIDEQFVNTQMVVLESERCRDQALSSPRWLDSGARSNSNNAVRSFEDHLDVSKDGEIIRVTFRDPDPKTASDAVAALIDAYQQLTIDLDPDNTQRTITKLAELKGKYEKDLEEARQRIADIAGPYTPELLETRLAYKIGEANQLESGSKQAQAELEIWRESHAQTSPTIADPTLEQLEAKASSDKRRFDESTADLIVLSQRASLIRAISDAQTQKRGWLNETKQRLEELNISLNNAGHISVLSNGDRPVLIYSEKLKLSGAVGGGIFLATLIGAALLPRRRSA